jgi:hypothetical protein
VRLVGLVGAVKDRHNSVLPEEDGPLEQIVTRVLQGCYKSVTRVLQGCYKGVTRVMDRQTQLHLAKRGWTLGEEGRPQQSITGEGRPQESIRGLVMVVVVLE